MYMYTQSISSLQSPLTSHPQKIYVHVHVYVYLYKICTHTFRKHISVHIVALQCEGSLWENLCPFYGVVYQPGAHSLVGHLLIVSYVVGCYLCLSDLACTA